VPRRPLGVRRFEHQVPSARVFEPFAARWEVHWTELPLAQRILQAGLEAELLFLVTNLQPNFDKFDSGIYDVFLDLRTKLEKLSMLFGSAETHDVLDPGPIV